jgi:signal transduction histidine kinase
LNLSLLESKELKLNLEKVRVSDVIERLLDLYKEKMEQKHFQLEVNIPDSTSLIRADEKQIEQVFANLLDNAIKFTPEGGKLSIDTQEDNSYIRVDVEDSGIGISKEHLPRVFERFYRADKARSRELGGTGLGLAIVKHIVHAHNGKVSVQSQPDKGSTFSVFLPKNP